MAAPKIPKIDVVIRTLAETSRGPSLDHALESLDSQAGIEATAIVVVNGQRFDPALVEKLKHRDDVRFAYLPEASVIKSLLWGRELVEAPYFTFLDDDDEFVPDSLLHPAEWLVRHPECDVAITNLYRRINGKARLGCDDMSAHAQNPLSTLMTQCWLHPGSGLFRSATIGADVLDLPRAYMEWTNLAFRLVVTNKNLRFMDVATVVYNDTADSMSKNPEHQENALEVLAEIAAHPQCDAKTKDQAQKKYANTLHVLATLYWQRGEYRKAWNRHLRSLGQGTFFKYLFFSRKLVLPARARV